MALKSEYNILKHKFDIIKGEKEHIERQEKMMRDHYKRSEENLMHSKKEIHTEKRKNEFLSRRMMEMEKSLSALTDDIGGLNQFAIPSISPDNNQANQN